MRKYKILFIDDEDVIISGIMEVAKKLICLEKGYDVDFRVLKNQEDIENMNDIAADIVLFDCALGGAAFDFTNQDEDSFGVEIMKRFRERNTRTKIIFYSGEFELTGTRCYGFTNEEILELINELHIYKMIPKKAEHIAKAIVEAIHELDSLIVSLEDLKEEYKSQGNFLINERLYSIENVIQELKCGSQVGEEFRKSVLKMVLTYMMKFGGDEE